MAVCPQGDLDGDCFVGIVDLRLFAAQWLTNPGGNANLNSSGGVDSADFAIFSENWQKSGYTLLINEFMADNDGFIQDPQNDYNDWIEIYNYGPIAIDIGGMYMTDILANPTLWEIPTGSPTETTIEAGGYLLIWADNDTGDGPSHVGFRLSKSGGEDIGLYDPDENPVDTIAGFGAQNTDESYGRWPNGSESWLAFTSGTIPPSPGKLNGGDFTDDDIIISEIMYHPYHDELTFEPEPILEEYIELYNKGAGTIDLTGWQFVDGIDYTFGSVTIGAGQYLVVAADVATFSAKYPSVTDVVGGWVGKLRNSREKIELANDAGILIDPVTYNDDGNWAQRYLGPVDFTHRGWRWSNAHDGDGKSLELINSGFSNEYGQNWTASSVADGTPGQANTAADSDIAPIILDVEHWPIIPQSTDAVTVTAEVLDELGSPASVTLYYSVDTSTYSNQNTYPTYSPGSFTTVPMYDDGVHDDGSAGDGVYGGQIPAQADETIMEFFVEATDAGANSRTWPPPSDVDSTPEQVTNLLYQVLDSYDPTAEWVPGSPPVYYLIMTENERGRLADIGDDGDAFTGEAMTNAQMNGTFICVDGTGVRMRYNTGIRNRGNRTRVMPPNNYHVNFLNERPWNNITALNINSKFPWVQITGSAVFRMAGIDASDASAVMVRVNGQDLSTGDSNMHGIYVSMESYNGDWAENHYPDDPGGNLYRCSYYRNNVDPQTWAELIFKDPGNPPPDPADYDDNYIKQTNLAENDWQDLFDLIGVLNDDVSSDADFLTAVEQIVDIDQWMRFFATDALIGNLEGGLSWGVGDDYAMYCGDLDRRFRFIPHDLDTILGQQTGADPDRSIFVYPEGVNSTYNGIEGLQRLFEMPSVIKTYYNKYIELIDTAFAPENIDPLLDQVLDGIVSQSTIDGMKQCVVDRIHSSGAILDQIPQGDLTANSTLPQVGGYYRTTSNSFQLTGSGNAVTTRSIKVDGYSIGDDFWSQREGTWTFGGGVGGSSEILVDAGAVWSYHDQGADLDTAWREPGYPDGGWDFGPAQLGYGDGDEATTVSYGSSSSNKYTTTYFRHHFNVVDKSIYSGLQLDVLRDDGAVIYLNGHEISRTLMPGTLGDDTINYLTFSDGAVSGAGEDIFNNLSLAPSASDWLVDGDNVLAVEIHQHSLSSTDISLDLVLQAFVPGVGGAGSLRSGINRIAVQAFDGPDGTGSEVESDYIDIWRDTSSTTDVSGILTGDPNDVNQLNLIVRDSYLPGVPILVRVEAIGTDGKIDRTIWDEVATLSANSPTVGLSTDQIVLRNGLGSSLITVSGSGDFTLTAAVQNVQTGKSLTDLQNDSISTVSGTLPGSTSWSGIVNVTGDLTVPAGTTLTIDPGTLILLNGVSSGDSGTDIDVLGEINSMGTLQSPVTFTAYDPLLQWGEIHHDNADASLYQYTNITLAGHSPGGGHTGTGPAVRSVNSQITFDYCTLTDNVGKVMQANGSDLTFTDCQIGRSIMGPEIATTALLFQDSWITEMYGTDDNDGIYIHTQSPGQTCTLIGGVAADIDDDAIDTADSEVTIEDFIVRDCRDKGISIYDNEVTINRCLVVNTNTAPEDPTVACIAAKAFEADTATINIDHTTIVTTKTGGVTDYGIQSHNKYGVSAGTIIWNITNSIIDATDPVDVQAPYLESDVNIDYSDVYGEVWAGTGNINTDPMFVDRVTNFHLQTGSPCIDTGDPVETDPDGSRTDMGYFVYDAVEAAGQSIGNLTLWKPELSPYLVTSDLTIPVGLTLKILPGTSVFFDTDVRMIIEGRLLAEGAEYDTVHFTHSPDTGGDWGGLLFSSTMQDNLLSYAVLEYGRTDNGMVGLTNSNLIIDHCVLGNTDLRRVNSSNSSLIIRNSTFDPMFEPGAPPTTVNRSEHILASGIPEGGHAIIENNIFGKNTGYNDLVDFSGPVQSEPILQVLNNVFLGGGDEGLDLGGNAHIEGNIFMNIHKDQYNTGSGDSSVITTGDNLPGDVDAVVTVVRNIFYDIDHVINLKKNSFAYLEHNIIVGIPDDDGPTTYSVVKFLIPERDPEGKGAYLNGNVFYDIPQRIFENVDMSFSGGSMVTDLEMHNCLVPEHLADNVIASRPTTLLELGTGNITGDPRFIDPAEDFHLGLGSPAIGTGPSGLDMGRYVRQGASIIGEIDAVTGQTTAQFTVAGPGVIAYKYSLNEAPWSTEQAMSTPITLSGLTDGAYTLKVIGKNFACIWQEASQADQITWTVDTVLPYIRINEVLANSNRGGSDMIELYNAGASPVDIGGMSITDNVDLPDKYIFPSSTIIASGGYLVLYADSGTLPAGIHLGFTLEADGDDVWLNNSNDTAADSIIFGMQIENFTIGRIGSGGIWALNKPTLGSANIQQQTGETATLKINEWLASADVFTNDDFIELYNTDYLPVDLSGLYLTDRPIAQPDKHALPPLSFIDGWGFAVLDADDNDSSGHVDFRLSAEQEILGLFSTALDQIDKILYYGQTTDVSEGRSPDGEVDYDFFEPPTPGRVNVEIIIINEVLAHSHAAAPDWIELYNTTDQLVDISGWYLSDSSGDDPNLLKYEIAAGTTIAADSYEVFYEDVHFNNPGDPGCHEPFAISENGEGVYLTSALDGNITPYKTNQRFGASSTGIAFGIHYKSDNTFDFVSMNTNTPGVVNDYPQVGPIIISEIMYHPQAGGPYDKEEYEYIELLNTSGSPVTLQEYDNDLHIDVPWMFTDGIDYTFPLSTTIAAGDRLIIAKNPTAFTSRYGAVPVTILGPFENGTKLSNGGEELELSLPGDIDADGRHYIRIDRVVYNDAGDWPQTPDGAGHSLTRINKTAYGNDVINWQAADPTPGW